MGEGEVEFDGAVLKIMRDLSRSTLHRRALLKPVLEAAKHAGITCRWGFSISVTFKKAQQSFTLRTPADLPTLFASLDTDPIKIPHWLQPLQRNTPPFRSIQLEESLITETAEGQA